ncbi:isocitrate lyase/PEP mutase family protein [Solimicrobium silvestre]|uniref:PEP phosphonomutase n=1 Tax=Solimicrobium silvestre TaxID=2099400 RepID=A0A2S9H3T5_9BURK|nr:isocitrate lyase/phosphoenolpyruvate mutase family protein [Solimicrobium silvestre]PRC94630.1 PEP phosphonomutase [Solimicrobium silvestre]
MNKNSFNVFQSLHSEPTPLLLPTAWDAASAALFQCDGAKAVATSSAALAWSLGYADGGSLPRQELLAAIRRIVRVLQVPLTVDLEDGYSDSPVTVAELIWEVAQCGVAGINLEDGANSANLLTSKIAAARHSLGTANLFINARTDVFLRNLADGDAAIGMTIERLHHYKDAGADGAFVPGMSRIVDVHQVAPEIGLPLNLMTVPGMPTIDALFAAGVRRVSAGPALFQSSYGQARLLAKKLLVNHDVSGLFDHSLSYDFMNSVFQAK